MYAIWKYCPRGTLKVLGRFLLNQNTVKIIIGNFLFYFFIQEIIAREQYVGDAFVMLALMQDIANVPIFQIINFY
jgi:hypothetical protein